MSKQIIMMKGLPASGKTTLARMMMSAKPNMYKRINRDDLRAMLDGGVWSGSNEKFIKKLRDHLIIQALLDGKHVIVDDTNLAPANEVRFRQLASEFNKEHDDSVSVQVIESTATLEQCILRDSDRPHPVGEVIIRRMHRQFIEKLEDGSTRYAYQDEVLPHCIVCDIDGTLALIGNRNPYDASKCEMDIPNPPVGQMLQDFHGIGKEIVLVSGRSAKHRQETITWLNAHNLPYKSELLFMRAENDGRKDAIVKKEMYENFIKDKYFVEFVLDDRDAVVELWRKDLKLPCFQVYYGNF